MSASMNHSSVIPCVPVLRRPLVAAALILGLSPVAMASGFTNITLSPAVQLTVSIENLAPANSVSFTPLNLGFHRGIFDAFNIGQVASPALIPLAETGNGSAWQSAFATADPTATRGTIGGILQPGNTSSSTFMVDSLLNPYFTFASMVVPSNDFFIGNDSPTRFRLFDSAGNLQITQITQTARQIWDAGSEVFDPATGAFIAGADASLRPLQNSVVAFNFAELAALNGITTAGGYTFNSNLTADTPVYRISFAVNPISPVPEPQHAAMLVAGLLMMGTLVWRRT